MSVPRKAGSARRARDAHGPDAACCTILGAESWVGWVEHHGDETVAALRWAEFGLDKNLYEGEDGLLRLRDLRGRRHREEHRRVRALIGPVPPSKNGPPPPWATSLIPKGPKEPEDPGWLDVPGHLAAGGETKAWIAEQDGTE